MNVIIKDKIINYQGRTINVDELFDDTFYTYANAQASRFYNDSYGVNEVYGAFVLTYLALDRWFRENKPSSVSIANADNTMAFLIEDICKSQGIELVGVNIWNKLRSKSAYGFYKLLSAFYLSYLMMKIPYAPTINTSKKFAVLRSKAAIKKFSKFPEIAKEIEDPHRKDSIYRLFPICSRLYWIYKCFKSAYMTKSSMDDFYASNIGENFKYVLNDYYAKRIIYAEMYKFLLNEYLQHFEGSDFYSGNNLDRFSVIEDQVTKRYNIKSYNIPHGIEYGFKFPKGFSSDVFYTHSQYAADHLNTVYNTRKYIFDDTVIARMFSYNCTTPHDQMVIFFTEPREQEVNVQIINGLLPHMRKLNKKLYIKLHPVEKREYYKDIEVEIFDNYDLSLTGNICISRKSTILLEAIYNQSIPVAIITNPKDQSTFNQFPALNAKEIIKTYSIDELVDVIKSNLKDS